MKQDFFYSLCPSGQKSKLSVSWVEIGWDFFVEVRKWVEGTLWFGSYVGDQHKN